MVKRRLTTPLTKRKGSSRSHLKKKAVRLVDQIEKIDINNGQCYSLSLEDSMRLKLAAAELVAALAVSETERLRSHKHESGPSPSPQDNDCEGIQISNNENIVTSDCCPQPSFIFSPFLLIFQLYQRFLNFIIPHKSFLWDANKSTLTSNHTAVPVTEFSPNYQYDKNYNNRYIPSDMSSNNYEIDCDDSIINARMRLLQKFNAGKIFDCIELNEIQFLRNVEHDIDIYQKQMNSQISEETIKTRLAKSKLHSMCGDLQNCREHNTFLQTRLHHLENENQSMKHNSNKNRRKLKVYQKKVRDAEHELNLMRRTSAQICSETNTLHLNRENELADAIRERNDYCNQVQHLQTEVDSLVDLLYRCEDKLIFYERLTNESCSPQKRHVENVEKLQYSQANEEYGDNCFKNENIIIASPLKQHQQNEILDISFDSFKDSPGATAKRALVACIKDMDSFEKKFSFDQDRLKVEQELRDLFK